LRSSVAPLRPAGNALVRISIDGHPDPEDIGIGPSG